VRREMARNNKDELIRQAAIRVFAREGFHQARMETIAHEAGVAVGTIYNYFDSKEKVLLSIFKAEFEERVHFYKELRESGLSIPEQIQRILQAHFSLLSERKELAQLLLRERFNLSKGFKNKVLDLYREMLQQIEVVIREGVEQGRVRSCNPRIIAPALLGVVQSISACGMLYPEEEIQGILQNASAELTELIWNGLKKGDGR
jgi:TetR/AcrR family fatty acid metabolism transcriptional regulator